MKGFWKVIGIAVLVGLLGVALAGAVAFAQEDDVADWPFDFRVRLHEAIAGVLGISVDEYDSAVDTAREQVLDEAVAEGVLTQERADLMQERAAEGFGPGMQGGFFGGRGHGGMMGGFGGRGDSSLLAIAAEQLEKAASELHSMDETKKDILYELGLLNEAMGRTEKAHDFFKQIYAVDIGYKEVAQKIEKTYKSS